MTADQPQTKALKPADEIRNNLQRMEPQFKAALPSHVSVERFTRVAQTAIASTPALLKADRASLFAACVKAAQVGLNLDGREAALVPFGDKVQFMPMLGGVLKLIRNSGELSTIMSEIVYEKDKFRYWIDSDGQHLTHEPMMFGDRGKVIGAYALAKLKDGALYCEMMSEEQILAVRNVSRAKDSGPWAGPFKLEMYKKTVIRRLAKRLPVSTDLDMALKADDEMYDLEKTETVVSSPAPEKQPKKSRLKTLITENTVEPIEVAATEIAPPSQSETDDEIPL